MSPWPPFVRRSSSVTCVKASGVVKPSRTLFSSSSRMRGAIDSRSCSTASENAPTKRRELAVDRGRRLAGGQPVLPVADDPRRRDVERSILAEGLAQRRQAERQRRGGAPAVLLVVGLERAEELGHANTALGDRIPSTALPA